MKSKQEIIDSLGHGGEIDVDLLEAIIDDRDSLTVQWSDAAGLWVCATCKAASIVGRGVAHAEECHLHDQN